MPTLISFALGCPTPRRIAYQDIWLDLGPDEVRIGRLIGTVRNTTASYRADRPSYAPPETRERNHQNGCGGELAVARFLNVYPRCFSSVGSRNAGADVGDWQVRSTSKPEKGLRIYRYDDDAQRFVLVKGVIPRYRIVGWYLAADAKRDDFLVRDPRGDYWEVPETLMRPFMMRATNGRATV